MNVLDYLRSLDVTGEVHIERDGLIFPQREPEGDWSGAQRIFELLEALDDPLEGFGADAHLSPETVDFLRGTELRVDPGMEDYDSVARRPCFRLRGRPVTPEQARDIIRRTDRLIGELTDPYLKHYLPEQADALARGYICLYHFDQWWFSRNHLPTHYGWSHPDGTIGCNGITGRWPTFREVLGELLALKRAFPYLDLCIAITWWNETPPDDGDGPADRVPDAEFARELEIGLCIHDDAVEVLNPENAAARYLDYAKRFPEPEPGRFESEFYERTHRLLCGEAYLLRCIMDYGLDAAAARTLLAEKLSDYEWRDAELHWWSNP